MNRISLTVMAMAVAAGHASAAYNGNWGWNAWNHGSSWGYQAWGSSWDSVSNQRIHYRFHEQTVDHSNWSDWFEPKANHASDNGDYYYSSDAWPQHTTDYINTVPFDWFEHHVPTPTQAALTLKERDDSGSGSGDEKNTDPSSVPTPSAGLGGLMLMGLLASRRNRRRR